MDETGDWTGMDTEYADVKSGEYMREDWGYEEPEDDI